MTAGIELVAMWRQTIEEAPRDGVVEMMVNVGTEVEQLTRTKLFVGGLHHRYGQI